MHPGSNEQSLEDVASQGLTLEERSRLIEKSKPKLGSQKPLKIDNRFMPLLKVWRSWFDAAGKCAWSEFLASEDLSESDLTKLHQLVLPRNKLPAWTARLGQILVYLQSCFTEIDSTLSIAENLAGPLVQFAWNELKASTDRFHLQLLSHKAVLTLRRSLLQRLVRTGSRVVQWETLAASAGRRASMNLESKKTNLPKYFFQFGVAIETRRLLENYPALARLWAIQVEHWLQFTDDFLRDAVMFIRSLEPRIDAKNPAVSELDTDLSDPHDGNRTVTRVAFTNGDEWFYKPRSGFQERAWFELLSWVNRSGFPRHFRILKVVCKDRHFWMEGVRARPVRTKKESADLQFRFGGLMCLMHAVRGVDVHPANIILACDQPIAVDCETLLHPRTVLPDRFRTEDDSVRRTGMLELVKGMSGDNVTAGFQAMHRLLETPSAAPHLKRWTARMQKIPGRNIYRPTAHYSQISNVSLAPSVLTNGLERSLYLSAACCSDNYSRQRVRLEVRALEYADVPVFRRHPGRIRIELSDKMLRESLSAIRATA